jgi:hypothetical protein
MISAAEPLADVARAHRARWMEARCGDRAVVRLDGAPDPLAALRDAPSPAAFVLDGLPDGGLADAAVDALAAAVERGDGVVLAVHGLGDALPASPAEEPEAVAARLAERIPGAVVIPQRLAELSIIAAGDAPVRVELDAEPPAPADVEAWLVVAGLPDAVPEPEPVAVAHSSIHRAYVRWLDAANATLRRANARMARERLGAHDAAAAKTARRIVMAEREREELREELGRVRNDAMQYFQITQAKLHEPHYRIAEGIVRRAGKVPGLRRVGKAVVYRLMPARNEGLPPGDG